MRVIITGSRDAPLVTSNAEDPLHPCGTPLQKWLGLAICSALGDDHHKVTTVVHGGSGNVDAAADAYANLYDREVEVYTADWKRWGKKAGPMRNYLMASLGADLCLAFWNGYSKGTQNMIANATHWDIPVRIVPVHGVDARARARQNT